MNQKLFIYRFELNTFYKTYFLNINLCQKMLLFIVCLGCYRNLGKSFRFFLFVILKIDILITFINLLIGRLLVYV